MNDDDLLASDLSKSQSSPTSYFTTRRSCTPKYNHATLRMQHVFCDSYGHCTKEIKSKNIHNKSVAIYCDRQIKAVENLHIEGTAGGIKRLRGST